MSIKIDSTKIAPESASNIAPTSNQAASAARLDLVTNTQSVQVSSQLQQLATQNNTDTSSFDAQKVAEIRQAIISGTLLIDPKKIADALLASNIL